MNKNAKNIALRRNFYFPETILTVMRTLLIFIVMGLGGSVYGSSSFSQTKMDIKVEKVPLEQLFKEIQKKSQYVFFYKDGILDNKKEVTVQFSNAEIGTILDEAFKGKRLGYKLKDRQVVIFELKVPKKDSQTSLQNSQFRVEGTVTDPTGMPIPGVNVIEKGTSNGVVTDFDGEFAIEVAPDAVLVFSYIGYETVEMPVDGQNQMSITMKTSASALEEVVIVGYGTQQRRDLTGAISSISSEVIENAAASNITEAIAGKVAGATITRSGWGPSAESSIRIRGTRSISAGNDPLIVVNGVPWSGPLEAISTSNVASIEVLKGTSATAIYGSRGANGVILVTTKQGSPGEMLISYNGYVGVQRPYRHLDLMNSQEWIEMVKESFRAVGRGGAAPNEMFGTRELAGVENGTDTDWQELVFQTGIVQDHTIQLSGGNDQTRFMISPSYFEQEGILKGQWYRRYTLYANLNHEFSDRFQTGISFNGARNVFSNGPGNVLSNAVNLPPVVSPYDENGNLVLFPNNENATANPLSDLQNAYTDVKSDRLRAVLSAQYDFSPELSFKSQFGPEVKYAVSGGYYGSETGSNQGSDPTAYQSEERLFHYTWNNILRYQETFADQHNVELTLVHTLEHSEESDFSANVRGLPYNSLYYNLGSAREITSVGSNLSDWTLLSYALRANYKLGDTYLLTLTTRADGSSRFAPGNKWGYFPSAALGWRISNEPFMNSVSDAVSNLMLRVEYGKSGNTGIAPYQVLGGLGRSSYVFGTEPAFGYGPEDLANPALAWETTNQLNVGIDVDLWQGRLDAHANFYIQNTDDLLLRRLIPASTGYTSVLNNIGSTRNVGFEFSLSSINISTDVFQWRTSLNFSTNKNEIISLYGTGGDDVGNQWFIGEPIDVYYDYEFGGIWQKEEAAEAAEYGHEPGSIRPIDQNRDGKINAEDRTILGTPFPDWTGGLTSTMSYKNFDFSFVMTTVQGNTIFNGFRNYFFPLKDRYNAMNIKYWTPSNPSNEWPSPDLNMGSDPPYDELLGYIDGSYVRVQRITLGYTLPSGLLQSLGGGPWQLYFTAKNPYVFASEKFMGFDPENSLGLSDAPSYRSYLLGMRLNF